MKDQEASSGLVMSDSPPGSTRVPREVMLWLASAPSAHPLSPGGLLPKSERVPFLLLTSDQASQETFGSVRSGRGCVRLRLNSLRPLGFNQITRFVTRLSTRASLTYWSTRRMWSWTTWCGSNGNVDHVQITCHVFCLI